MRARVVVIAAVALLVAGCGGEKVLATVGAQKVMQHQVDDGMAFLEHEAKLENRSFPADGTPARTQAEHDLLLLLVRRARFEAKAEDIGVGVTREEVQARLGNEEGGATPPGFAFHEASVRAGLLYGKLFERVTSHVNVPNDEVRAFYASHRKAYPQPFAEVRDVLRAQLLSKHKVETMRRWERQLEQELPAKFKS
jgi:hypothetical protein